MSVTVTDLGLHIERDLLGSQFPAYVYEVRYECERCGAVMLGKNAVEQRMLEVLAAGAPATFCDEQNQQLGVELERAHRGGVWRWLKCWWRSLAFGR